VNLRSRVRSYFGPNGGHTHRTARLKTEAARLETLDCGSELEALLVESKLIKVRVPLYNVLGRTYRHYPFIKIPAEPFPRVHLTYELVDDGGTYFGPFPGEYRAREALEAMRPLFRWRSCTPLPKRVCFEHAIGRCSAPCVGLVDEAAYAGGLDELAAFLGGGAGDVLRRMEREMEAAAADLRFERAAVLRNRLSMLAPWVARQGALQAAIAELDVLIVLPSATPGAALWLVVRRGRLVHTEEAVTRRRAKGVEKRVAAALAAEAPSLSVRQAELDEINIISAWLHKHRDDGRAVSLAGRPVEEALAEAWAVTAAMENAAGASATAAERTPERVVPGPEA
jgi:excinuclease UvrABC nuclease subunit